MRTTFFKHPKQIQYRQTHHTRVPQTLTSRIHDDFFVLLTPLSSARATVLRNGKLLFDGELRPGMLRLVSPGEMNQVTLQSQLRNIALVIPGASARKALRRAGYAWHAKRKYLEPLYRPSRIVARVAAALQMAAEMKDMQQPLYIEGLTDSLFACLIAGQQSVENDKARRSVRPLNDAEFKACVDYADSKMGERLTVQRWAAALNMDAADFARRFRKRTNLSPYAWFLDRRIERAKTLLHRDPDLSIIEVALKAGFGSQSHFTEAFRRRVGCSPARWRMADYLQNA